jgi:hypothetical protein
MTDDDLETKKNTNKYNCKKCYFITCKKTDYTRHLETQKHKNNKNDDLLTLKTKKTKKTKKYIIVSVGKNININKEYMYIGKNVILKIL